jgi:Protein of unknown function (DUF3995)
MMLLITVFLNMAIFALLSSLHFYWAFGGKWGFEKSLPEKTDGAKLFHPKALDCLLIALILMSFSYFHWLVFVSRIPFYWQKIGIACITGIFILRAIGEFKYVGFFKSIRGTTFAKMDDRYYSPICIWIGINGCIGFVQI